MPSIVDVLSRYQELLPRWLCRCPTEFNRNDFFGSRTVYYPGSGYDGQPISFCIQSQSASAFIYVDYQKEIYNPANTSFLYVPPASLTDRLTDVFPGYDVEYTQELRESDVCPGGWVPNGEFEDQYRLVDHEPFASFVVLRRQDNKHYSPNPIRLAILFIKRDGIATFDALYCQDNGTPAPFMIVAFNHGFGGNYDPFGFGQDGILQKLAKESNKEPKWLLVGVGENTKPWEHYVDAGADAVNGGPHRLHRSLYMYEGNPK